MKSSIFGFFVLVFFLCQFTLGGAEDLIQVEDRIPTISWLAVANDPDRYNEKEVILIAPVEGWQMQSNPAGGWYFLIDIYRDITGVFESDVLPKKLQKQDMVKFTGKFYSVKIHHGILMNNVLIIERLKRTNGT